MHVKERGLVNWGHRPQQHEKLGFLIVDIYYSFAEKNVTTIFADFYLTYKLKVSSNEILHKVKESISISEVFCHKLRL